MSIREALAAAFLAAGLAGLLTLGTAQPRLTLTDADPSLTAVFIASLVGTALGGWLFYTLHVEVKRYKAIARRLNEYERRGLALVDASLNMSTVDEMPSIQADIRAWRQEVLNYVKATCPSLAAPFHLPAQAHVQVNARHASGIDLALQVAGTLERIKELLGRLHE
jgi:hypothetical protein